MKHRFHNNITQRFVLKNGIRIMLVHDNLNKIQINVMGATLHEMRGIKYEADCWKTILVLIRKILKGDITIGSN